MPFLYFDSTSRATFKREKIKDSFEKSNVWKETVCWKQCVESWSIVALIPFEPYFQENKCFFSPWSRSPSHSPSRDTIWLWTPDTRGPPASLRSDEDQNINSILKCRWLLCSLQNLWMEDSLVKRGDNVLMWHINCFIL